MRLAPLPRAPFLLLAGCALLGSPASPARADGPAALPAAGPRIVHHRIEARFEPATSRIVARDVVDVDVSTGGTFTFSLGSGIDAVAMTFLGTAEGTGAVAPQRGDRGVDLTPFSATLPEGVHQVEIRYSGTIVGRPGDPDRGGISGKGLDLTSEHGWYPTTARDGAARFDVDAWVPAPWLAVTQGGIPERSSVTAAKKWTGGERIAPLAADPGDEPYMAWNRIVARAVFPTQGCALLAGPYVTATKEVAGIAVSTWFLHGEAADAPLWLDAAAEVVKRYERFLGTYPHPKFDIVEGLFPRGASGPSCAWLSEAAIHAGRNAAKAGGGWLPTDTLAAIYVRGWFGDGIFVSPADGDWSFAAAGYFGTHLMLEFESPTAAMGCRFQSLLLLELYGTPRPERVALRALRGKLTEGETLEAGVKGAMVFHLLRKRLGDGEFFARVRRFAADHVGQAVGWTEWLAALDGEWVRPYLERTGVPALRLASASAWPATNGDHWNLRTEVVSDLPQGEGPWPPIDLAVEVDGKLAGKVHVEGNGGVFRGTWPSQPGVVEVDPGCEALREVSFEATNTGIRAAVIAFPDAAAAEAAAKQATTLAADGAGPAPASPPAPTTPDVPGTPAVGKRDELERRLAAAGLAKLDVPTEFPLGVADLQSKRDLILTTANGTEVLPNAFRPLFNSAERDLGTPLPFGTAEGVPLPGRIPDTSPEGLARFFRQLSTASPTALFVIPSAAAREGLAPFLDAPNDLTPTAEAELGGPGPDGKPRSRPDLRAWISARRARAVAGPGPTALPLPVLLLEDAAYDRLDRAPTVTAVDFAVKFGPERATWAAGKGGTNVVYGRIPPAPADVRPPVVVLSASYDALDGGTGVACVLAALEGLFVDMRSDPELKPGLIVCLLDGSEQGYLGSRALAPALLARYDVRAVVHLDRVGHVRDDSVSVLGRAQAPALAALAEAAFEGTGLHVARPAHEAAGIEPGDHAIYATLSVPAIGLTATGASTQEAPGSSPDRAAVARVAPGLRELMMRLLSN